MPRKSEWKNPARLWRQQRLQELLDMIKEHKNARISEIIAKLSLEYGLSERKVKEYLRVLEAEGKIVIDWLDGVVRIK
jgi:DeoR/GlpR family transcriptional regulator of sugar metabolism